MANELFRHSHQTTRETWNELVESIGLQDLQLGDASLAVKSLQLALQGLALFEGEANRRFTIETQQAVIGLQRQFALPTTGIFDAATWYVLSFNADINLAAVAQEMRLVA